MRGHAVRSPPLVDILDDTHHVGSCVGVVALAYDPESVGVIARFNRQPQIDAGSSDLAAPNLRSIVTDPLFVGVEGRRIHDGRFQGGARMWSSRRWLSLRSCRRRPRR